MDAAGPHAFITPGSIVTAAIGFVTGGLSMAFNPLFAVSLIAVVFSVMTLRSAMRVEHHVAQGLLRIFAIIGVMGGLGGVVTMIWPGLGVTPS